MNLLRYAWTHMTRSLRETLLTLLTYVLVLVLIMSAQQSALSRQATLDDMILNIPVVAQLTDPQGNRTTNLQVLNSDLNPYRDGGRWSEYVGELNIGAVASEYARVFQYEVDEAGSKNIRERLYQVSVVGVTSERSDPALENAVITYADGYDRTVWATMEPVCLITEDMQKYAAQTDDGSFINLVFTVSQSAPGGATRKEVTMTLRVIGAAPGEKMVFVPFYLVKQEMYDQGGRYSLNTDRLSFTFADNTRIDEFRDKVKAYYVVPDQLRPNFNHMLGLIIKDARYLQLKQEAEKNLAIFQLMQPVLYLCAIGAGVLLMVMQMRARKREMAIVRSVGCGMWRVLWQCLLEYALICLPVTTLSPLVWPDMPILMALAVFAAFMAGAVATILRFACIPLGKQIRALED